jgi:hypothetical protein
LRITTLNTDLDEILKKFELILFLIPYAEVLGEWTNLGERINIENKKCSCFSFSDTFVICSRDTTPESLNTIIIATFILSRNLFALGFPVRGAITKGEADYIPNTNHLIGKAIIEAARLEKRQNWFGVILSPEVLPIGNNENTLCKSAVQILTEYSVPFKDGENIPHLVINWRLNLVVKYGTKSLLPKPFDMQSKTKIDNTLKFAKYLRDTKQAYKKLNEKWQQNFYVSDTNPTKIPPKQGDDY